VTRVAKEVGTEGKLGGQATVKGVGGVWKDLTDNVNLMAGQLTNQIRNIADVTTAVANGDLSKKITVDVQGEILELKNTINTMVDQLNGFASEVTRVAREVGTEGKLGGQAEVKGVAGTWKDLTDNVNTMAGNLTSQVRNIAEVTTAVANGDISKKITVEGRGEILELKNTINTMVDQLNAFAGEVTRVAREVGTEGKLGGQAQVKDVGGVWKDLTDNVNLMAGQLTEQVRGIARVVTAVANGDLSKTITVDAQGEILELKNTTNTMVGQLNAFAGEVTRVAREVGTEGKLGGQATVKGVGGTWKDLTDNVNLMAANLTEQVRGIARVVTAVANGDLRKKLSVEAKGEVAELGATINEMTDTLAIFADQVTTVAREVGVEGKLGGQASVPGASGTWKDLTDNVNQLAANLTTQLRAIADVATSVTEGDLNREIGVAASGEVAVVKDKINQMIVNLADTTQKNAEQDWLKTNLTRFTRVLQGQRDLMTVSKMILSELAPLVNAQHGVFYAMDSTNPEEPILKFQAGYAYKVRKNLTTVFRVGEGLVGQCALEKERILLTGVPNDYVKINSALGEATPLNIIVLPVLFEGQVRAVIELASFDRFSPIHQDFLDQLTESIGIVLNTIEANMTTETLLKQSQSLAHELQSQQEELQKTNEELEQKARLLAEQNTEVERKNLEVEQAKRSLEEKAEQLEITSRYKSEFLANMSHELRTPLNSLLILAQQLSDNPDGNLSDKQVEFSRIIRSSGQDLLSLINDILDLSKIESGTVALELERENVVDLYDFVERTFRHIADAKKLRFAIELAPNLPRSITTDAKRLQQVLKNLLSNAFKFTEKGSVELRIELPAGGWSADNAILISASSVISFAVHDTGIGIAADKQRHIFEAFQQADGSTARKYGGTGLGLSISRELVRLLGGEIRLKSEVGGGTVFTVYLPVTTTQDRVELPHLREIDESHDSASNGRPVSESVFRPSIRQIEELPAGMVDDRRSLEGGDRTVLILEDDPNYAKVLLDLAHQSGFKGLIALNGETALLLARQYRPSAITLDLGLRDMSGWAVLDRLKHDPETAEIPVHIISVFEDGAGRGMTGGASTYLTKPVGKETLEGLFARIDAFISTGGRRLLVVEDDPVQRKHIMETVATGEVEAFDVGTGKEALEVLRNNRVDCVILDLRLPDVDGHKLIDQIHRLPGHKDLPIIVYTAAELSLNTQARLRKTTKSIIQKSPESSRALALEVKGFFDRVRQVRPTATAVAEPVRPPDAPDVQLGGRRALVVDDDVRNIFALTALLERQGMEVLHAESGGEAVQLLHENPSIEVVLMDIMMPDMDGYETMSAIRRAGGFENLPIVALTAKAMKGDREKCLEAGASDYIAKPVDPEQLLALLRSWLSK
jgi:signal transduction histidine kinase/DNA-binding response OmpR family regulator/HAMP domain-containing protein